MPTNKKLYVGTVNGENSWYNKLADTYIYSISSSSAAKGLFIRYMKKFGKAEVTDIFTVDKENKSIHRIQFIRTW